MWQTEDCNALSHSKELKELRELFAKTCHLDIVGISKRKPKYIQNSKPRIKPISVIENTDQY